MVLEHLALEIKYLGQKSYLIKIGVSSIVFRTVGEDILLRGMSVEIQEQIESFSVFFFELQPEVLQC